MSASDRFKDEPLILNNSGRVHADGHGHRVLVGEFLVPEVLSYPLTIEAGRRAGDADPLPADELRCEVGHDHRNQRRSGGSAARSRSPATRLRASSSITGRTYFGGVKCGRRAFRTIAVCNVGDCDLHVNEVAFKRKSRHWKLVHNPFPATLHPGSCLNVVIRYNATENASRGPANS